MKPTLLLMAGLLCACGVTPGREVAVRYRFAGDGVDRFTTATGWEIRLDSAQVRAGPLHLFENPPPLAARGPLERAWSWIVPSARAHAGDEHFNGGRCLTEWLDARTFDALAAVPVELGTAQADAGLARSFTLLLEPGLEDGSPLAAKVEGSASKAGAAVRFILVAAPGAAPLERRLQGARTELTLDEGSTILLEAHPSAWLRNVDFALAPAPGQDGTIPLDRATVPGAAFALGLRSAGAFTTAAAP